MMNSPKAMYSVTLTLKTRTLNIHKIIIPKKRRLEGLNGSPATSHHTGSTKMTNESTVVEIENTTIKKKEKSGSTAIMSMKDLVAIERSPEDEAIEKRSIAVEGNAVIESIGRNIAEKIETMKEIAKKIIVVEISPEAHLKIILVLQILLAQQVMQAVIPAVRLL